MNFTNYARDEQALINTDLASKAELWVFTVPHLSRTKVDGKRMNNKHVRSLRYECENDNATSRVAGTTRYKRIVVLICLGRTMS